MKRILGGVLLSLSMTVAMAQGDYVKVEKAKASFADVKDNLVAAIESRGLVINATSHVGSMLERTGQDVGSSKRIYQEAQVLDFCSAKVSRAVMEADPTAIALCPYSISIYTLPGKADTVYVAYRRFPSDKSAKPAADLVAGIVKDAIK